MNQQERGKSRYVTNERKGNGTGWDSSTGVEVFGRRRCRYAVESDTREIRARENTNGEERYCIVIIPT